MIDNGGNRTLVTNPEYGDSGDEYVDYVEEYEKRIVRYVLRDWASEPDSLRESDCDVRLQQNWTVIRGFLTVLTGIVVPSLLTIAVGLAGFAGLGLVSQGGRPRLDGERVRVESFGTGGGIGATAPLVGVFDSVNSLPELRPFALATGLLGIGFLLFIVTWEYG